MFQSLFVHTVNVIRRTVWTSASKDEFNDPIYGDPTTWATVYTAMPCRLVISDKAIQYHQTGERVIPTSIRLYFPTAYTLNPEDRVITTDGREYIVEGSIPATGPFMSQIDHNECYLSLP